MFPCSEEEKRAGHFSLQFDQNLVEPNLCENSDILRNNNTCAHLQVDGHSESSNVLESSSFRDSSQTTMEDENGIMSNSESLEVDANALNQGKTSLSNGSESRDEKVVSVADLLCAACNSLLFRPVVLNCGHGSLYFFPFVSKVKGLEDIIVYHMLFSLLWCSIL